MEHESNLPGLPPNLTGQALMESSGYLQEAFTPHIFFLPFFRPAKMLSVVNFQIWYFEKVTVSSKYIRSNVLVGLNFTKMWKIIYLFFFFLLKITEFKKVMKTI